ncbi:MAG: serine hydrolase family protein [Nanoarchaeales archaeon]|nr:serine hydrolase family protein [Nanoarchaeales archaeon]
MNWFNWLKNELESRGHEVFVPTFPTTQGQSLENWLKVFEPLKSKVDSDTIFIGHSLGPAFILNILERLNVKVRASILVAGFLGLLGHEEFDKLNGPFSDREFDFEKIKNNCENFYVINSKDDPYVPLSKGVELAEKLGVDLIKLDNSGHINSEFGFDKFEFILKYIDILEQN